MSVFSPGETALLPRLVTRYINLSACIWVQGTLRFLVWSFMRTLPSASPSLYFMLIGNILFYFLSTILLSQYCNSIVPLHGAPCTKQVCHIVSGTIFIFFFLNLMALPLLSHSATLTGFTGLNQASLGGILKTNIGLNVSVWTHILLCGAHKSDEIFWQNNVTRRCTVYTVHTGKVTKAQIIHSGHSFHRKYSC